MGSEFNVPILRLRAGAMKDCKDLRILSRTLDVAELFIESPPEERESLTTFSKYEHQEHDVSYSNMNIQGIVITSSKHSSFDSSCLWSNIN